ncbi:MAG TPA: V-type ATP synthase subunit B, partial [bacterium]|nr:V-type ATP synthase subunit B [bacterium]
IGITADDASFFIRNFNEATNISNITMFLNLANDPTVERLMTPRIALTFAEFLAFQLNYNVLVIITDITNYCEALREISILRNEIPGRKAYPGYLYSDLASLYERAGIIKNSKGSITQLPILTMPNDDITHPIPDLTGFITEGQIVLNRELHLKGIYPPINVLTSLSRLMKDGIGKGFTRDDHSHLASQLFALYSKVQEIRELASVIGEDELTLLDHKYLEFGNAFENNFINQSFTENRNIIETLNKGWECIKIMPEEELHRLTEEEIKMYYKK